MAAPETAAAAPANPASLAEVPPPGDSKVEAAPVAPTVTAKKATLAPAKPSKASKVGKVSVTKKAAARSPFLNSR
jgi:hypothetical protein